MYDNGNMLLNNIHSYVNCSMYTSAVVSETSSMSDVLLRLAGGKQRLILISVEN